MSSRLRPSVYVENLHRAYRLDDGMIRRIAAAVLKKVGRSSGALDIAFLDDRAMRVCNRRYTRHDRTTDVLSFPLEDPVFGQIVISIDRAAAQSVAYGTGRAEELVRYVVHGILHLCGYDDITRADRERMSAKEDRILRWLATKEDLSRVLTPR